MHTANRAISVCLKTDIWLTVHFHCYNILIINYTVLHFILFRPHCSTTWALGIHVLGGLKTDATC